MALAQRAERGLAAVVLVVLARKTRAGFGARRARGGGLGLELFDARGKLGRGRVGGGQATLEEFARMPTLRGGRAQIVKLAAERTHAIALGRKPCGGRVGARLKLGQRFASRLALGVEFLGARATLLEASALFEQPARGSQPFQFGQLDANRLIGLGLFGLAAGERQLAFDFGQHVVDAGEVLAHAVELALAHLASALEKRKPGRLFDHPAQLSRLGLDDLLDSALFDQGVAAAMNLRGHEELGDVLQPAGNFIYEIFGFAGAVDPARDAYFA